MNLPLFLGTDKLSAFWHFKVGCNES